MKNKNINFEYVEEFVDYVLDKVVGNEDLFLSVVAKFDDMKEIVKNIMLCEDVNFEKLDLTTPLINGYEDEYILELFYDDGVLEFNCMPLIVDRKYNNPIADEVFIFDDCRQKIVFMCEGSLIHIVHIYDEEDECDCDEECGVECPCDCHNDDTSDRDGFSIKVKCNLDADEAMEIIDKMETRLLEVCKIFEEMNNMKNLLRF